MGIFFFGSRLQSKEQEKVPSKMNDYGTLFVWCLVLFSISILCVSFFFFVNCLNFGLFIFVSADIFSLLSRSQFDGFAYFWAKYDVVVYLGHSIDAVRTFAYIYVIGMYYAVPFKWR